MNRRLFWWVIFAGLLSASGGLFAQAPPDTAAQAPGQVIDIEAQVIDARIELPQVQILEKRRKAKFDEVKVDKDFRAELSGKNEELRFTPKTSQRVHPIRDIEALLKKSRY